MKIKGSTKFVLLSAIILIVLGILFTLESQKAGRLKLIFCDVGQGDGILIVTPKGKQVVVDGGPGTKVVDCLSSKMPFWDRTIEMMILTHAQEDHIEGQVEIFNRYKVERVVWNGVENETALFDEWQKLLSAEKSQVHLAKEGDLIKLDKTSLEVLWPTAERLSIWQTLAPTDLNESSVVVRIEYGDPSTRSKISGQASSGPRFCAYLTVDLAKEILEGLINKHCQILKISHHGSKTGTSEALLELASPKIAVIQVGKNRFGHPHKEVLDLLTSKGIKILRNDTVGTIEIESGGKSYTVN